MSKLFFTMLAVALLIAPAGYAAKTSSGDSRIKTLIYNESEVYQVVARSGFQSQIEFGASENIETISIGDPIGWQVTPAGNRIFIKPLHKTGITNLSVITNKKGYQFELVSTSSASRSSNHAYLIRFYYPDAPQVSEIDPDDRTRNSLRPVSNTAIPLLPQAKIPAAPIAANPVFSNAPINQAVGLFNFNYTLTGANEVAPKKIYDDGNATYFEFAKEVESPVVSIIKPDGSEEKLGAAIQDGPFNKTVVVKHIEGKFNINSGGKQVQVFNEQILSLAPLNPNQTGRN